MSFTINFYKNESEPNKINKSLTNVTSVAGVLKEGSSILSPIIIVEGDLTTFANCNYMAIDSFGNRKYFITDIRSINNKLIEISGRVDVLQTYATQILAQTAVIERQENNWNLYLEDGIFKEYANPKVITKAFPSGFDTMSIVLAVAGGTGDSSESTTS